MTLNGHAQNGVIVLDEQVDLPEGVVVRVQVVAPQPVAVPRDAHETEIPTLAESLKDFIGILDLPEDAARNHDHYLYGTPKK